VRFVADEVMVMYLGHAVEHGAAAAVFDDPQHPYTQALLSATPTVDAAARRQRIVLQGELPSPLAPPPGCTFHTRCPIAEPRCRSVEPRLAMVAGRDVACLVRQAPAKAAALEG
jgi:dipeptide transport system ATP-binding protein